MRPSDLIVTAESRMRSKLIEATDGKKYLAFADVLEFLSEAGRPLEPKDLDFRRDSIILKSTPITPELIIRKVNGSKNRIVCELKELENYAMGLYSLSTDLTYNDAKTVVEQYDQVLLKSRKYGMRGQRNFTGKIEDEIRGKLVELGFSKYVQERIGLELPVDYKPIEETERRRDYGDFTKYVYKNNICDIPKGFAISLKSTNGNFLAVPEIELTWEGDIFVLAKLHIKQTFLYKAIKAGLQLGTLDFGEVLGWFELRGFISKKDFIDPNTSIKEINLPGKYALETNFRSPNYIIHPNQLNRNASDLHNLLAKIKGE